MLLFPMNRMIKRDCIWLSDKDQGLCRNSQGKTLPPSLVHYSPEWMKTSVPFRSCVPHIDTIKHRCSCFFNMLILTPLLSMYTRICHEIELFMFELSMLRLTANKLKQQTLANGFS